MTTGAVNQQQFLAALDTKGGGDGLTVYEICEVLVAETGASADNAWAVAVCIAENIAQKEVADHNNLPADVKNAPDNIFDATQVADVVFNAANLDGVGSDLNLLEYCDVSKVGRGLRSYFPENVNLSEDHDNNPNTPALWTLYAQAGYYQDAVTPPPAQGDVGAVDNAKAPPEEEADADADVEVTPSTSKIYNVAEECAAVLGNKLFTANEFCDALVEYWGISPNTAKYITLVIYESISGEDAGVCNNGVATLNDDGPTLNGEVLTQALTIIEQATEVAPDGAGVGSLSTGDFARCEAALRGVGGAVTDGDLLVFAPFAELAN